MSLMTGDHPLQLPKQSYLYHSLQQLLTKLSYFSKQKYDRRKLEKFFYAYLSGWRFYLSLKPEKHYRKNWKHRDRQYYKRLPEVSIIEAN